MDKKKKHGNYLKFFTMIVTSMVVMFFLMYANSHKIIDHFWFSETRFFMTLIMGGAMIIIMLLFMVKMYTNIKANTTIVIGGFLLIAFSIWIVRSQVTVGDVDYMEGMIPHHSIAILTSENSKIQDVRVRELADAIIKAQKKEIKEMEWLIKDIRENGLVKTKLEAETRSVPKFSGTLE